jgi:hypothetical protein
MKKAPDDPNNREVGLACHKPTKIRGTGPVGGPTY